MAKKDEKVSRDVNGIQVEQRVSDGFINATAMCLAHNKNINDWFTTQDTLDLFFALADDLNIEIKSGEFRNSDVARLSASKYAKVFLGLVLSKRGSPDNGGGTWLHPDLAIQLAQWCSKPFAIQVSRWIREWMTTGKNPVYDRLDLDRVIYRDALKDQARIRMTDQVKVYLEQIKKYDDEKYRGIFFSKVHDAINIAITTETSKQMKERISEMLGKKVNNNELIRDYFPPMPLQRYISVCEAAANFMLRENLHPLTAVERAIEIVLPADYVAQPIDFVEHIKFVRRRISDPIISPGLNQDSQNYLN
jgi:hypothetical protein